MTDNTTSVAADALSRDMLKPVMGQVQGTFKLVSRGIDGFDLVFSRIDGFGDSEQRRTVSTLADAIDVVERVIGRPLTAGEKETLAISNGLVASISSENYSTYF